MSTVDEATTCIQELNGIVRKRAAVLIAYPDLLHDWY